MNDKPKCEECLDQGFYFETDEDGILRDYSPCWKCGKHDPEFCRCDDCDPLRIAVTRTRLIDWD